MCVRARDDQEEYEENQFGEIEEIEDEVDQNFKKFKNFNVHPHPPNDHRFILSNKLIFDKPNSTFSTKIKEEWEILKVQLPNSFFVTTYESRVDLMRACIVGLEGTPYRYGLFFFDILFPTNYSVEPPELFYHSSGFDLNHNLRKDRRVSVNLLNLNHRWRWYTWLGIPMEQRWNPKQSDIREVLVSIQRLILSNNKDKFERDRDRDRAFCLRINEVRRSEDNNKVFMSLCEDMLYTLKVSPEDFHVFVQGHFRKWAHCILMIFKAQMGGHGNSVMKQLFFRLLMAFEANGAYCEHHYNRKELVEFKKENSVKLKKVPQNI